jgi:hypothetical protein
MLRTSWRGVRYDNLHLINGLEEGSLKKEKKEKDKVRQQSLLKCKKAHLGQLSLTSLAHQSCA